MQRKLMFLAYALATAYALWRAIRITFFPIAMSATQPAAGGSEIIQPAFAPERIPILILVVLLYAIMGYALYSRAITIFRILAIVHIVLSLLSLPSYGQLFLPSSVLLLLAVLLSIGANQTPKASPLTR
ncbi:MAG TPA: hypothetical protein VGD58_02150 [Herpetosiphonaceae bacterium]